MAGMMGQHDGVPAGPFESEPLDLGRVLARPGVPGDEVVRRCERWLVDVLDGADVALGASDAEIAGLVAAEGWSVAQVVGGWVRRAAVAGQEARAPVRELVAPGVTRVR
ncbi:hypothetical protein [Actinomycetospora cinnamomea]|uniref:Uncharacterized protein n=1 Tax=Actinomycetospora cinnamomea TaxID=663609 RepID=A0A2U1E7F9_9PSEU|nr:hypothetical protein [Actinomycetospora cinnamomea]PVY95876.1 hypothetical protein C8D89_13512 [Actinomycetospora cinnamomea]